MTCSSAVPCASAMARESVSGTSSSSSPCMSRRGRGANRRAASTGRKRRSSRLHSSNCAGNVGDRTAPISRVCSRKRRGCSAQSSKSARGPSNAQPLTRGSSDATHKPIEAPVLVPSIHTWVGSVSETRWSIAERTSSTQPCNEKSPSLFPHPRNVNVIPAQPNSLAIRSISSGNELAECRASCGPIGNPWHNNTAGRAPGRGEPLFR